MHGKNKKNIKNKILKIKKFIKWYKIYDDKKYFELKQKIINVLMFIMIAIVSTIGFYIFLYFLNDCQNENLIQIENKIKFGYMDILSIQISNTLIIISVISLLSGLSEKYLLGEKHITVIFPNRSLFSLIKIFSVLIILLLINIVTCLKEGNKTLILLCFSIHLILIIYICMKMIVFYTHKNWFRTNLMCRYLYDQRKHIKNAVPLNSQPCRSIIDLKNQTLILIQKNDNDYNYNINTMMDLIDLTLFNDRKELQEYYTEMISRSDLISSIYEVIKHLVRYEKYNEAANILLNLHYKFNYYKFAPVYDEFYNTTIDKLIDRIKYIKKESEAREYINIIWNILNQRMKNIYLYENEIDLSYCRLYKENLINIIFNSNMVLEKIYICIIENKHLTEDEKYRVLENLYDEIRMMEHKEKFPDKDFNDFMKREFLHKEKIFISYLIKGEPIILMFLKMIEKNDSKSIKIFRTMNLSREFMHYIIMSTTLSILNIIYKENVREYVDDLNINVEKVENIFKETKFHRITLGENELSNMYTLFLNNYFYKEKRTYFLRPRLETREEVLNNYFYYLYNDINQLGKFYELISNKKFLPNSEFQEKIKRLNIVNKIVCGKSIIVL